MVGRLALDYTDAQLRTLIERTFEVASKYKIAVGLHIDDSKFWMNRSDLWRNPANVEWLDWNGTPNTGQYLNWGEPWKLAPHACFNSQAVVKEARRITREVIGPAITAGIENLRRSGDKALFAGVIVGWETAIGRDFDTGRDLGYCALTNLGYSANSPPPDFDRALESVVQSWIETWSSGLADAGVPRDKIYSHIAFTPKKRFDEAHGAESGSYSRSVLCAPPWVAFGESHRAGFSTYPNADSESVIRPKVAELEQNMKDGRLDALKRNLDQIEADIDAQVAIAANGGFDVAVLQQKVRALPQKIAAYQQNNGDMNRIKARVEAFRGAWTLASWRRRSKRSRRSSRSLILLELGRFSGK